MICKIPGEQHDDFDSAMTFCLAALFAVPRWVKTYLSKIWLVP